MERIVFTPNSPFAAHALTAVLHGSIPSAVKKLPGGQLPTFIITRKLSISKDLNIGTINSDDVVAIVDGHGDEVVLIDIGEAKAASKSVDNPINGDQAFIDEADGASSQLGTLAEKLIAQVRLIDPAGELKQKSSGRWVNHETNFFTLKVQPRKGDIQFTLYGNPDKFAHAGFLKQDQNSYSRGYIQTGLDLERFLKFASRSFGLRTRA